MSNQAGHWMNEHDIGSGDKSLAEHETEKMIEEVGKNRNNPVPQKDMKQQQGSATQQHAEKK
jgi:hypothetical protein